MADSNYGRLFTEREVRGLIASAASDALRGVAETLRVDQYATRLIEEMAAPTFPPDEPLFLLRGQDRLAWASVEHYAVHCDVAADVGNDHASAAHDAADAIHEWQAANLDRVKVPD